MLFTQRLELMQQSQQISETAKDKTIQLINIITQDLGNALLKEATAFITHSAIAINRTINNQALTEIESAIIEEVKSQATYAQALMILSKIQALIELQFTEAETILLLAHLCALLEKSA